MAAKDIINSGGFEGAFQAWQRAGGGSKGRAAARRYLEREHGDESTRSIDAVLNRISESIQRAKQEQDRYDRGRSQPIQKGDVPDLSQLQRDANNKGRTVLKFRVRIDIFDPETNQRIGTSTIVVYGNLGDSLDDVMRNSVVIDNIAQRVSRLITSRRIQDAENIGTQLPYTRTTVESIVTVLRPENATPVP